MIILIIFSIFHVLQIGCREIIWETTLGPLIGYTKISLSGFEFYAFEGIPFGKPPIGDLRFKAPVTAGPWYGVLNATKYADHCIQTYHDCISPQSDKQSEDCLYLNIYTRNLGKEPVSDIIFTIFGGQYHGGTVRVVGPNTIMDEEDVIFITVNYRLNIYGFLSFFDPDLEVHGNAGAKDVVLALQWVQMYIQEFGGDPRKVTITGCSSAAHLINLLALNPSTSTLFRHAITQSGSALLDLFNRDITYEGLAYFSNFTGDIRDEHSFYKYLLQIPAEKLTDAYINFKQLYEPYGFRAPIGIVIESKINNPSPFLTEHPDELILQGKFSRMPILAGFSQFEAGLFHASAYNLSRNYTDFATNLPLSLKKYFTPMELKLINEQVKEFYYGNQVPDEKNYLTLLKTYGDIFFFYTFFVTFKSMARASNYTMPIYMYEFNTKTPVNLLAIRNGFKQSYCSHCDEIGYIYSQEGLCGYDIRYHINKPLVWNTIKRYRTFFMHFVRTGNPNSVDPNDELSKFKWKPITSNHLDYLIIQPNLTLARNPFNYEMKFWHGLIQKFGKNKNIPHEIFFRDADLFP